ncbi:Ubiquitin-like superfamily protein isoform 1 [Hibiscus syriacus]|uniref:Mechanosensitive ion channel protein n=1 Tax=Hibiscus syriacus TaxID=106335 RepID=A0A6A3BHT2_HIBSY|nr:Ubiquitin-like superfamily protein isoform 1 [Hibiscus syriacus]
MEPLRKSLKSYCSNAKQHQGPEEQPLLIHSNYSDTAESVYAREQGQGDVVVNIDSNDAKENWNTSKVGQPSGSSKKFKVSFHEVLTEAVRQKGKDLPGQSEARQWSFDSGVGRFSRSGSGDYLRQNSWRQLVNKTKSRLLDPVEHRYRRSYSEEEGFNENSHEEEDMEDNPDEYKALKLSALKILQWLSLVLLIAALVCSVLIPGLKRLRLWDLHLWKWEIMVLALICGRLVSGWVIRLVVILIERNFLLRKRVLYFVYGLRRPVQNSLWLGLVLLVWNWIFDDKVQKETNSKVLASSFHVNTFFDRIQEALFNQYVIEMLSGPPLFDINSAKPEEEDKVTKNEESQAEVGSGKQQNTSVVENGPRTQRRIPKRKDDDIQLDHLRKLNQKNISVWNMRRMIKMVSRGHLTTLDEQILNSEKDDESSTLCGFMDRDESLKALNLFGAGTEEEGISKASLNNWLVNAFRDRKALTLSLNDTKTAVDELHNMLNIVVAIIIVIIWLMILGIPVTHFLVFISSQLLLVVFIFGNTCKTVFEAIIFLFIMHPFDVGDRCEVDGMQCVYELRFASRYIESREHHWHGNPLVVVTDVEEMNKLKILVASKHRMNYQNMSDRWIRRGHLLEEMIKILKELDIEYRLLPMDVNVKNMPTLVSHRLPSNWSACVN